MDKADLIREVTTRLMGGTIDDHESRGQKIEWYATFLRVSRVVNILEELDQSEIVDFKLEQK